jgi:hypothetical protein
MAKGIAFKPVLAGAGAGAALDGTNTWTGVNTFDAQVQWSKGADVASATALPILTDGNYFDVTGTTTITSIATTGKVGTVIRLHFDGILTLTHNATDLVLPGAANITTAAGDEFTFVEFASGDFRCVAYALASGKAVVAGITAVVDDTSPQAGGDFDMNANQMQWSKGADVASATALPVLTDGNYYDVTGTTTITSINTTGGAGTLIKLHFDGILTLTHNATDLILPGAANIVTAAGDEFEFTEYATGDYRCTGYALASGEAVVGGGAAGAVLADGTVPMTADWVFGGFALSGVDKLTIIGDQTTTDTVSLTSTTHTSGELLKVNGNSSSTTARSVVDFTQDNISAINAKVLTIKQDAAEDAVFIDQNGNGTSIFIDSEATTEPVIRFSSPANTTQPVVLFENVNSLTSSGIIRALSNAASTSARKLVEISNGQSAAIGATVLHLEQAAAQDALFIDMNGNGTSIELDSEATSTPVIKFNAPANANSPVLFIENANSLTSAGMIRGTSNAASSEARKLVEFSNGQSAATGTTVAVFEQNAANQVMILDQNATAAGSSFIDYQGTAAANATGPVSTFTTSGATTNHIQIEINGTKAWIAVSTNDPS